MSLWLMVNRVQSVEYMNNTRDVSPVCVPQEEGFFGVMETSWGHTSVLLVTLEKWGKRCCKNDVW